MLFKTHHIYHLNKIKYLLILFLVKYLFFIDKIICKIPLINKLSFATLSLYKKTG